MSQKKNQPPTRVEAEPVAQAPGASSGSAQSGGEGRPIVTALALVKIPGQGWTSIVYRIQGDRILKVTASEPDLKVIASEKFKINAGQVIISDDGILKEVEP